jgi:hypothetical protein
MNNIGAAFVVALHHERWRTQGFQPPSTRLSSLAEQEMQAFREVHGHAGNG